MWAWDVHCLCSLKNHGADDDVDRMFEMGVETMKLPLDEKLKYEQGDEGVSFGYACPVHLDIRSCYQWTLACSTFNINARRIFFTNPDTKRPARMPSTSQVHWTPSSSSTCP